MAIFFRFTKSIDGFDSSRQLALGLALGAMIGLIPKDNLIFVGLLVTLIVSGANFVTGAITTFALTAITKFVQPAMILVGDYLLNIDWLISSLTEFYEIPFAAWTRLDNTVVAGSFATSVLAFVPVYLISFYFFERHKDNLQKRLSESAFLKWIVGYEPVENRED